MYLGVLLFHPYLCVYKFIYMCVCTVAVVHTMNVCSICLCSILFNPLNTLFCISETSNGVKQGAKETVGSGRLALPLQSRNRMTNPKFAVTLDPAIQDKFTKVMLCFTKQSPFSWLRKIHQFYKGCGCDFQGKSQYNRDICPLSSMVTCWLRRWD